MIPVACCLHLELRFNRGSVGRISFIAFLIITQITFLSAQVVNSGKSYIHFNNTKSNEVIQNKVTFGQPGTKDVDLGMLTGKGKYYALIIGIDSYDDPFISHLDQPVKDAEMVYNTLVTRYTFEEDNTMLLKNATISEMVNALDYFSNVITEEDNFLIFYAGHGHWDGVSEIGFWLPSDAMRNSKLAWFRNSTLRDYLKEINSKHTLLISDACFAGSILKTRKAFADYDIAISSLYGLPSRKAMTSGTLTEVPDQSIFLKYLVDRLQNNFEKYLSSEQLFSKIRIAVINNSKVLPQYGVIQEVGDEGGDFIFIRRE